MTPYFWFALGCVVTFLALHLIGEWLEWRDEERARVDAERRIEALPPLSNSRRPR